MEKKKKQRITILYEDTYICVCKKPAGIPCESAKASQPDMVKLLKKQYFLQNPKAGEPYIALVHRLDQPVGGIMVFARERKAAADLSSQIRGHSHTLIKKYLAVVTLEQDIIEDSGHLEDYLIRDGKTNTSRIVTADTRNAKLAILDYKILKRGNGTALVNIILTTGRHHQIRVQMAGHGMPLMYDRKYNPNTFIGKENIALHAYYLAFFHPITKEFMEFTEYPSEKPFVE